MNFSHYEKGVIADKETGERLTLQYNPEEIQETNEAKWANLTVFGVHHPRLQYVSGAGRTITFTLRMYGTDNSDSKTVKQKVDWLRSLLYPDVRSQTLPSRRPHMVLLAFGRLYPGLTGVLTRVNPTYSKLFSADLLPRYAEVEVEFVEFHVQAVDWRDVRGGRA